MLLTHLWDDSLCRHAIFRTYFTWHSHHLLYSSCDNRIFMQLKYYIYIFLSFSEISIYFSILQRSELRLRKVGQTSPGTHWPVTNETQAWTHDKQKISFSTLICYHQLSAVGLVPVPCLCFEIGTTQLLLPPEVQHSFTPGCVSSMSHLLKQDWLWIPLVTLLPSL